jgi:large subunit ribosomal protein L21
MEAYAVVETGGKQYLVQAKDILRIERLQAEPGAELELGSVLAISDGAKLRLGRPLVEGAKVISKVLKHMRGTKVVSFKKRRRKGYARKVGHRQELTVVEIQSIQ